MPRFRGFVEVLPRGVLTILERGLPWLLTLSGTSLVLWGNFYIFTYDLSVRVIAAMAVSSLAVPLVAFYVSSLLLRGSLLLRVAFYVNILLRRRTPLRLTPAHMRVPNSRYRPRSGRGFRREMWRLILDLAPRSILQTNPPEGLWDVMKVIALISFFILWLELSFLLIPLMIFGAVCWVLVLVGAQLLSWVLGIVLARLTGNDRLKGVLVFAGIAVFIVGNALQLGATWL
jgi:hypothetical protein